MQPDKTVHSTTSLHTEEISRLYRSSPLVNSVFCFFFLTDVDKEERTWRKFKWEQESSDEIIFISSRAETQHNDFSLVS